MKTITPTLEDFWDIGGALNDFFEALPPEFKNINNQNNSNAMPHELWLALSAVIRSALDSKAYFEAANDNPHVNQSILRGAWSEGWLRYSDNSAKHLLDYLQEHAAALPTPQNMPNDLAFKTYDDIILKLKSVNGMTDAPTPNDHPNDDASDNLENSAIATAKTTEVSPNLT